MNSNPILRNRKELVITDDIWWWFRSLSWCWTILHTVPNKLTKKYVSDRKNIKARTRRLRRQRNTAAYHIAMSSCPPLPTRMDTILLAIRVITYFNFKAVFFINNYAKIDWTWTKMLFTVNSKSHIEWFFVCVQNIDEVGGDRWHFFVW